MDTTTSDTLFARAGQVIAGGVNSPVRAFTAVGGTPRFIGRGWGSTIVDLDGNRYLDLVGSWGPLALGHAHPHVLAAAHDALERGSSFGAPCPGEVDLAELLVDAIPSVDLVRLVNSGTEAAMTAVRLARGATGRTKILKFIGHYHGHSDAMLVAAGSGMATLGIPGSPGVTPGTAGDTVLVDFNDPQGVIDAVATHGDDLAAIIAEPVAANMNLVAPDPGFLALLREQADACGALLVLDEVITGFRLGRDGAQGVYGVAADLTVLGKIIGGGFPLAAVGGRRDLLEQLAPTGPIYQAGTLSGNPVACAAGAVQVRLLTDDVYRRLREVTDRLVAGLRTAFAAADVEATVTQVGTLAAIVFTAAAPRRFADVAAADHDAYARFFHAMLDRGVSLAPSGYEILFTSAALADEELQMIIDAAHDAAATL